MRQHRNRQIAGKSVGDRIADFVDRHMCGVFITPAFLVTIPVSYTHLDVYKRQVLRR